MVGRSRFFASNEGIGVCHTGTIAHIVYGNEVMSLSGSNGEPWLKWDQIEKFLGQKLPFREKGQTFLDNMMWVDGYVQDILKKAMPHLEGKFSAGASGGIDVFETHEHVIIQVKLSKEENPRAIQVFVKSHQVKISGFVSGNHQIVKLPAIVVPRTAKARYKQRLLQIQIRKRGLKENYHEAYIRF